MQRLQDDYLAAYRSLKLTQDSEGVVSMSKLDA